MNDNYVTLCKYRALFLASPVAERGRTAHEVKASQVALEILQFSVAAPARPGICPRAASSALRGQNDAPQCPEMRLLPCGLRQWRRLELQPAMRRASPKACLVGRPFGPLGQKVLRCVSNDKGHLDVLGFRTSLGIGPQ